MTCGDLEDWDSWQSPLPLESKTIKVRLVNRGRGKPLPCDDELLDELDSLRQENARLKELVALARGGS